MDCCDHKRGHEAPIHWEWGGGGGGGGGGGAGGMLPPKNWKSGHQNPLLFMSGVFINN